VYRADGSSYSVPYSDVDVVELSPEGREVTLVLRGGTRWHVQGESLQHLADLLDMHAAPFLAVTAANVENIHYSINSITEMLPSVKQTPAINVPKRG
jgi:hypothetical protein